MVRLRAESQHFTLAVEDDGPGLEGSSTTSRVGSGLGMRITRAVAAEAGWAVAVATLSPRGTRVAISGQSSELPREECETDAAGGQAEAGDA